MYSLVVCRALVLALVLLSLSFVVVPMISFARERRKRSRIPHANSAELGKVLYTFVMLLFQFWFHAHVNGWHARLRITLFVTKEFMKLLLCHAAAQLSNFQALTWSVCRAGEARFWQYFDPRKKPVRFLRCCHCSGRNLALQSYCAVNFGVCAFVLFIKKCAWVSRNTGRWFVNIVKKQFTLLTAHTTNSINCDLLCRSTKQHVNSPAVF